MLCYSKCCGRFDIVSEGLGTPGNEWSMVQVEWTRQERSVRARCEGPACKRTLRKVILSTGVISRCAPGTCLRSLDTDGNALS